MQYACTQEAVGKRDSGGLATGQKRGNEVLDDESDDTQTDF